MSNKLLLQDLIDQLSESGKLKKKDAEEFLRTFFKVIEESLYQGEVVKIQGLGTFKLLKVNARKSVNVSTGEDFEINEHFKVSFIPDPTLKELINKPYSHLEPVDLDLLAEKDESIESIVSDEKREGNESENNFEINKPVLTNAKKARFMNRGNKELDSPEKNPEHEVVPPMYDSEDEDPEEPVKNHLFRSRMILAAFILMVLALAVWAFLSNRAAQRDLKYKMEEVEAYEAEQKKDIQMDKPAILIEDSLLAETKASAKKDSIAKVEMNVKKKSPAISEFKTSKAHSRVSDNRFPITEMIKQGSRLTLIALKYYGNKAFWVYIYEANKDRITNPNKIPVGTKIRIPKPDSAKINAKDPESIAKAKDLQTKILSK